MSQSATFKAEHYAGNILYDATYEISFRVIGYPTRSSWIEPGEGFDIEIESIDDVQWATDDDSAPELTPAEIRAELERRFWDDDEDNGAADVCAEAAELALYQGIDP